MGNKKTYYLSLKGEQEGPYTHQEVLDLLARHERSWSDFIYSESKQEWVLLMEHPEFTRALNEGHGRPEAHPIPRSPALEIRSGQHLREKEWYVLRQGQNHGPFSRLDLIQMLQQKSLFEHDFIWNHSMSAWKRVADVPEFDPTEVRSLRDSNDRDLAEVFFRRRHLRMNYGCTLLVHDNKSVFKGQSLEISEGGAGLVVDHGDLKPGQTIYLHFLPGDGVPPFNAVCTIVSKRVRDEAPHKPHLVKYGVQFTSISQPTRESIRRYTGNAHKAA